MMVIRIKLKKIQFLSLQIHLKITQIPESTRELHKTVTQVALWAPLIYILSILGAA